MTRASAFSVLLLGATAFTSGAQAQYFEDAVVSEEDVESPENWALELRGGTYQPNAGGAAFDGFFKDNQGPLLSVELDYFVFTLDDWSISA